MSSFLTAGRAAPRIAPSFIKKGAKRKGRANQKTTKFEGLVPTLPVDGWEPHFWETDGWEVPAAVARAAPEESAPSAPTKKWWHVEDAEIERMLAEKQGKDQVVSFPRDVERVSHVEPAEEVPEVPEAPDPEPSEDGEEKEKEKPWKVTDEQLQRWIDDMQHGLEASAYDDGGGATERSLEKHLQGILSPRKAPKIRVYLSVGCGTLVLRVPEDLPLDLVESVSEARRLRQQKTMRPRRKASLALERLLGSRSTADQAALESDRHRGHCLTRIIQSLTKIPCDNQRLIHQKRILRPPGTLKDLGVFDGHELTLVPKVSKGEANPLTLQTGGALHLIEPWRWDDNPKLLAQRRNDDAGFNTSEVHLNDAQDPVLGRLRTQLGIMK